MKIKRILYFYCLSVCVLLTPLGYLSIWIFIISLIHFITMLIIGLNKKFTLF